VEDELLLARSMECFFKMNGVVVKVYNDGGKAKKALSAGEFDLLITDLGLPSMDGFELIREAERLDMLDKVIVISGAHSEEDLPDDIHYIKKPFDLSDLLKCVRKCFKRDNKGVESQG
jgi:DNA-binding response OmpR family regulator